MCKNQKNRSGQSWDFFRIDERTNKSDSIGLPVSRRSKNIYTCAHTKEISFGSNFISPQNSLRWLQNLPKQRKMDNHVLFEPKSAWYALAWVLNHWILAPIHDEKQVAHKYTVNVCARIGAPTLAFWIIGSWHSYSVRGTCWSSLHSAYTCKGSKNNFFSKFSRFWRQTSDH